MEQQQNRGPRGLFIGGACGAVLVVGMGLPDAGREVLKEESLRLYHAVRPQERPQQPAPLTTGSINPPKATPKKPTPPDAITRLWLSANYILGLGWLVDEERRDPDGARSRKP